MTEDEAKTKMCCGPQTVAAATIITHGDPRRVEITESAGCCIASQCMAWRWSDAKRTAAFLDAVQAHMKASLSPNFAKSTQAVYAERGREFENTEGYCGLAGRPE